MSQNQDMEITHPPALDLDPERVGQIVLKLATAAAMAGHKSIRATLRDYVPPERGGELEFVRDLFTRPTRTIADKWYGGEFEATCLATSLLAAHFGG